VFSVRSTTEATVGNLEITIAKKDETAKEQVKGKVMLELLFNHLELFTCSPQKEQLQPSTATKGSFTVYTIQFAIDVMTFDAKDLPVAT
jgi:hypothetical protein